MTQLPASFERDHFRQFLDSVPDWGGMDDRTRIDVVVHYFMEILKLPAVNSPEVESAFRAANEPLPVYPFRYWVSEAQKQDRSQRYIEKGSGSRYALTASRQAEVRKLIGPARLPTDAAVAAQPSAGNAVATKDQSAPRPYNRLNELAHNNFVIVSLIIAIVGGLVVWFIVG